MRVSVRHSTRVDYSTDVLEGVMEVRLGPLSDEHQRWNRFGLDAAPNASVCRYVDGFRNAAHLVTIKRPHRYVEVTSTGDVETLLEDPFAVPERPVDPLSPAQSVFYIQPSRLVPLDPRLPRLASAITNADDTFEVVQALMTFVYDSFTYEKRVTDVTTTVTEVIDKQQGVCQDFAHVLIGLCRSRGIPARYVSGYVVSVSRGNQESHAWAEAFTPTHGWRGFDPTNNLVAATHHIKAAIGRDYRDVAPTRGAYRGMTEETLSVQVAAHALD